MNLLFSVKSNYEGSMSTGSQNDADDSSGDENFVMPSQAEISNLVETFEQSLIVKGKSITVHVFARVGKNLITCM